MLLSDRDIRAEVTSGRIVLDPYDDDLVQPSSVDVRLDRFFRVFENHRYPHIDPAVEQPDLTRLVGCDSVGDMTQQWSGTLGAEDVDFLGVSTDYLGAAYTVTASRTFTVYFSPQQLAHR